MAVCLEAGQIATGNVETTGGIISGSVPEHDNGEQSRLIYYLVCCLIIALIYILCLIYILQPFARRLALSDSEINKTHQNPTLGFTALGLIPQ